MLMPGSGDSVQALKAGIMEIPDVIAINKMDQPGAKAMLNDIRAVISLDPKRLAAADRPHRGAPWRGGRRALGARHRAPRRARRAAGELEERRRRNLAGEVVAAATARAVATIEAAIATDPALAELVAAVQRREIDPLTAGDRIAAAVLREATP